MPIKTTPLASPGAQFHAGNRVLANATNSLQLARPCICVFAQNKLVCGSAGTDRIPAGARKMFAVLGQHNNAAQCSSVYPQIQLDGALRCPAGGFDYLSADFTWRQLVPDFAALVRNICVAMEAWTRGLPGQGPNQHTTLGLQLNVRPSLALPRVADVAVGLLPLGGGPCAEAPATGLVILSCNVFLSRCAESHLHRSMWSSVPG